ncbi:hypothetical protein [Pseudomonas sp. SDT291_1_S447]
MQSARTQITRYLLALLLLSGPVLAATGPETAQLLNRRYQNTTAECAGAKPAYFCSGVLVRGSDPALEFWKHGEVARKLGAEGFVYLRGDLDTQRLALANGMVFSDSFTAIGNGLSLEVLCAYPFAFPSTATRANFGCAALSATQHLQDVSSCADVGVSDAPAWLAHFQQQGQLPEKQCSLSSLDPAQFKASLLAHQGIDDSWSARPNKVQIKNWDPDAPGLLPVQGLYYDVTQPGALLGAQKDQRDYFIATGEWLPILRMNLSEPPDAVFGFNLQDQLYIGYRIAANMNARFADTASGCLREKPGFHCNGVLVRGADASAGFHAWNPSPNSIGRNGVSFSYVRKDVGTTKLAGTQGFTFKEAFAPTGHAVTWRCAYPANAGTNSIPDSCRASCQSQGITTVAAWQARYASNPSASCAFDMSLASFQLSIDVRAGLSAAARLNWNEVIIAVWPQNIPALVPLEAFFYVSGSSPGLANAQFIQRDYFTQTHAFLPVIRLNLASADGRPFVFEVGDQTVQDTSTQTLVRGITPRPPVSSQKDSGPDEN